LSIRGLDAFDHAPGRSFLPQGVLAARVSFIMPLIAPGGGTPLAACLAGTVPSGLNSCSLERSHGSAHADCAPRHSLCEDSAISDKLRVLLTEDDPHVVKQVREALRRQGHSVDVAGDGPSGLELASTQGYDAVVLDIGLPGFDGLEVLRRLRAGGNRVPVLVLTGQDDESEVVRALEDGADDYLTKPASLLELTARLQALHRRATIVPTSTLKVHDLELDTVRGVVRRAGRKVPLTETERDLLGVLMTSAGRVVTHQALLEAVWGIDFDPGTNVLPVHISRLRSKLESRGERRLIHTVREVGYELS